MRKLGLVVFFAFAAAFLPLASACTTEEPATPTCDQDVTSEAHKNVENGCNGFAVCKEGNGDPEDCCADECCDVPDGSECENCVYGYGGKHDPDYWNDPKLCKGAKGNGGSGGSNDGGSSPGGGGSGGGG